MLDRFLERFKFFKFDEITNERLKEPNYFTAPFIAAHLNWFIFLFLFYLQSKSVFATKSSLKSFF